MNKENIINQLAELGFELQEVPEMGYVFEYEGMTVLYMPDDDEEFIRFGLPNIFEVTEENRPLILEVANSTNLTIKYAKVCVYGESVWVFYEYRSFGNEDTEALVEHSLLLLGATLNLFHRKIEGEDSVSEEETNDETTE